MQLIDQSFLSRTFAFMGRVTRSSLFAIATALAVLVIGYMLYIGIPIPVGEDTGALLGLRPFIWGCLAALGFIMLVLLYQVIRDIMRERNYHVFTALAAMAMVLYFTLSP